MCIELIPKHTQFYPNSEGWNFYQMILNECKNVFWWTYRGFFFFFFFFLVGSTQLETPSYTKACARRGAVAGQGVTGLEELEATLPHVRPAGMAGRRAGSCRRGGSPSRGGRLEGLQQPGMACQASHMAHLDRETGRHGFRGSLEACSSEAGSFLEFAGDSSTRAHRLTDTRTFSCGRGIVAVPQRGRYLGCFF